jgi:hypothetical protein
VSVAIDPFSVSGGHTSGLAVDADGTFHPTWIDNRTGLAQLWTTSIKVDGSVIKNGSSDLAELEDISKAVTLELSQPAFDRVKGTLSLSAELRNTSKDAVEGPVKVRVLGIESEIGVAEITNADNGEGGTGAVWDFSPQLGGAPLASMKLSGSRPLTFRITDLRALGQGKDFKAGLLSLQTRIYGKVLKEKSEKEKEIK